MTQDKQEPKIEFCPQHGYPIPCDKCGYNPNPNTEQIKDVLRYAEYSGGFINDLDKVSKQIDALYQPLLAALQQRVKELEEESAARAEVIKRLTNAGTKQCPECGGSTSWKVACKRCKGRGVISVIPDLEAENARLNKALEKYITYSAALESQLKSQQDTLKEVDRVMELQAVPDDHVTDIHAKVRKALASQKGETK